METPIKGHEPCLCGSGQLFRQCCRQQPFIPTICPDPGLQGYSILRYHTASFSIPDGNALRQRLHDDMRLHCVEDTPARTFWLVWGAPALENRYGIICFGDLELRDQHTLIVTALSPVRLRWILTILEQTLPPGVASPTLTISSIQWIERRTGLPVDQAGSLLPNEGMRRPEA
jgi:hypothetical protein